MVKKPETVLRDGLRLVVVSRRGCHRCDTIRRVAGDYGVPVEVAYFHEGGAEVLAHAKFLPIIMPAVVGYRDGKVAHRWNGVSEFLEAWENIE